MACIALLANPLAMTTTQLARATFHEASAPWQPEFNTESPALRMNWVVIIDKQGSRHLRMNWAADED
jgi:hypothetical protein